MQQGDKIKDYQINIRMSSTLNVSKLFQINMNHDRHRLKINRIKTKSSPVLKKQKQQVSIMSSRHTYQSYNSQFKHRESAKWIDKKNSLILNKIQDLSRPQRPNSIATDKLRNSMILNRSTSKRETNFKIEQQNSRFVSKLCLVKPTINKNEQSNRFNDHMRLSQMLSKFKKNQKGMAIPKNSFLVEKRMKLQPIHQKRILIQSRSRSQSVKVNSKPIKFNSTKLLKINPQR